MLRLKHKASLFEEAFSHTPKIQRDDRLCLKQRGAKGIVIDEYIRDYLGLEAFPDCTVCAHGTSPIKSSRRWRISCECGDSNARSLNKPGSELIR